MAGRRTFRMAGATTADRTAAVAAQLSHECSILLELYRKKEKFTADVADRRLVSVPPPSSQLDTKDKLWCLHSALLQCCGLMDRAISKEKEELDSGVSGEYEDQRKLVKDRLLLLLSNNGELLLAADGGGSVPTPSVDNLEPNSPTTVFELKVWVYQIYKEVDYWTKVTITTLQGLPVIISKDQPRTLRATRSSRRAQR